VIGVRYCHNRWDAIASSDRLIPSGVVEFVKSDFFLGEIPRGLPKASAFIQSVETIAYSTVRSYLQFDV
tara:strand:- start:13 stop:219 length:207 start_codon:yes stop_codon:yes gene_type:complete